MGFNLNLSPAIPVKWPRILSVWGGTGSPKIQAFYQANPSFAHVFNRAFPDVAAIAAIEMFEIMFAPKTLTLKENCPLSPRKVDPKNQLYKSRGTTPLIGVVPPSYPFKRVIIPLFSYSWQAHLVELVSGQAHKQKMMKEAAESWESSYQPSINQQNIHKSW